MPQKADDLNRTRTTLINRLKDWQDQVSWQEFFDSYWKLIFTVARRTGLNEAEAQDVVQETMLSVAKHMPTFTYDRRLGSFKAWLLKMTRWRVIDQIRMRKKTGGHQSTDNFLPADANPLDDIVDPASQSLDKLWDEEWTNTLVDAATARVRLRLDPEKYQIFDFYVKKGWPPDKVAQKFGISRDQVYVAKYRIIEMIKEEVNRLNGREERSTDLKAYSEAGRTAECESLKL
jgi:RNA polymerase sigma factor (sigma-70 family)